MDVNILPIPPRVHLPITGSTHKLGERGSRMELMELFRIESDKISQDREDFMGSSEKYWQWARDCERWARQADKPEDRELYEGMAKAWTGVALADEDVTKAADRELPRVH